MVIPSNNFSSLVFNWMSLEKTLSILSLSYVLSIILINISVASLVDTSYTVCITTSFIFRLIALDLPRKMPVYFMGSTVLSHSSIFWLNFSIVQIFNISSYLMIILYPVHGSPLLSLTWKRCAIVLLQKKADIQNVICTLCAVQFVPVALLYSTFRPEFFLISIHLFIFYHDVTSSAIP